jgi:hypothetical protein
MVVAPACRKPQAQTCKVCGHADKFNFDVPDEIWQVVVPEELQNRVVCLSCFDDFAYRKGVPYAHALRLLCFAGDQATFEFQPVVAVDRAEYANA